MRLQTLAMLLAGACLVTAGLALAAARAGVFDAYLWANLAMFAAMMVATMASARSTATGRTCGACGSAATPGLGFCAQCGSVPKAARTRGRPQPGSA